MGSPRIFLGDGNHMMLVCFFEINSMVFYHVCGILQAAAMMFGPNSRIDIIVLELHRGRLTAVFVVLAASDRSP